MASARRAKPNLTAENNTLLTTATVRRASSGLRGAIRAFRVTLAPPLGWRAEPAGSASTSLHAGRRPRRHDADTQDAGKSWAAIVPIFQRNSRRRLLCPPSGSAAGAAYRPQAPGRISLSKKLAMSRSNYICIDACIVGVFIYMRWQICT